MGTYDSTMLAAQSEENAKMASWSLQAGGGRQRAVQVGRHVDTQSRRAGQQPTARAGTKRGMQRHRMSCGRSPHTVAAVAGALRTTPARPSPCPWAIHRSLRSSKKMPPMPRVSPRWGLHNGRQRRAASCAGLASDKACCPLLPEGQALAALTFGSSRRSWSSSCRTRWGRGGRTQPAHGWVGGWGGGGGPNRF